jgi:hypothetical protein
VCSSDPATCQFGKRGSIAAIAEAKAYVKNHLSNSSFGYLTQCCIMTCVIQLASLWMLTLKDTSWLSFFTYVHGATMVATALSVPTVAQLKSYFPGTPGSRYTTLIAIDILTYVALLVFLGASWLDDASVMNLTLLGTLRTVLQRFWDLVLNIALSSVPSATVISVTSCPVRPSTPDKCQKSCSVDTCRNLGAAM